MIYVLHQGEIGTYNSGSAKNRNRQFCYGEVIRFIFFNFNIFLDNNKILIFGQGEAKIQLKKEMQESGEAALKGITVKSADKLTEKQIAAEVRQFFSYEK